MTPSYFRSIRDELGLTGERLARLLRVDGRTIRKWEAGDRKIPGSIELLMLLLRRHGAGILRI